MHWIFGHILRLRCNVYLQTDVELKINITHLSANTISLKSFERKEAAYKFYKGRTQQN